MPSKALVLDANILVRAVLGRRAREVIEAYAEEVFRAAALALGCPIWKEDTDFFGCGVATWTSHRVQMFLRGNQE